MCLIRNQRHNNHASYNVTDTADDKASVLSVRTGTHAQWHIKLVGTYYVCVRLRHVLVVLFDDPDHQDTHPGPHPVLASWERAPPHFCKSISTHDMPHPQRMLSKFSFADHA